MGTALLFSIICLICLAIFFIVIRVTENAIYTKNYCIKLEYTTLRDMLRIEIETKRLYDDGKLKEFPSLTQYLDQSKILFDRLCDKNPIIIFKRADSYYIDNLSNEIKKAPDEILYLVDNLSQALENWYYRKHPIFQKIHNFKKSMFLRFLCFLLIIFRKMASFSNNRRCPPQRLESGIYSNKNSIKFLAT